MGLVVERVEIRAIPHHKQRYPTVGDWLFNDGTLHIVVSIMANPLYQHLVAMHEYAEAMQCLKAGIGEKVVTDFDLKFEQWRKEGKVGEFDEPGNDPRAPYHRQHLIATDIEKIFAESLGVNWDEYDLAVNSL